MRTKITHAVCVEQDGRRHPGITIHGPTGRTFIGAPSWEKAAALGRLIEERSTFDHGAMWCPDDFPVEFRE